MEQLKRNFLRTLPVMTGYLVLGAGFGILLQSKGYGFLWAFVMSGFIYAGSMQFVAVDLITTGAGLITAALTTLMVNARHLFYGISMVERYKSVGAAKPYLIFGLTDETYSLVCGNEELDDKDLLQITLLDQSYWVGGSLIGSLLGAWLPVDFSGMDFALTALFVCIVTDQWLTNDGHLPALIGIGCSVVCLLIFGADSFLIPAMLLITAALTLLRRVRKEAE